MAPRSGKNGPSRGQELPSAEAGSTAGSTAGPTAGPAAGLTPGPAAGQAAGQALTELVGVMARLRAECDWKAAQSHRSLARYLLEEAHETLEAIDSGELTGDWTHLREELGDLLLQVYFHAEIAAERGEFTIDDVAADLIDKMVRRNPHVFGTATATGPASVNELWESVKATEKPRSSVLDGIPPTLPALLYADKVLDRLSRRAPKRQESPREVASLAPRGGEDGPDQRGERPADLLGDRLLALVAECREVEVDPEQALRDAVRRLLDRTEGPPPAWKAPNGSDQQRSDASLGG